MEDTTYRLTRKQLREALRSAIDMYREYLGVYGYDDDGAREAGVHETIDGLDADRELVASDPTERLHLQLPD